MMPASTLSLRGYIINETRSQTSDGSGIPEIVFSGAWNHPKNGFLRQVGQDFSSFFAQFLMFFQSFTVSLAHSTLKNHQICQKICKKNEKSIVQLA